MAVRVLGRLGNRMQLYDHRSPKPTTMPAMRACATANAVFVGLALTALAFAACSNGSSPPAQPPAPESQPPPPTGAVDMPGEGPSAPAQTGRKTPDSADDCKQIRGNSSDPSGGVVMNNAMTSGDAGSSDRLQGLVDVVRSRRDAFRCCFDVWAKKNPASDGKVVMVWSLKADGSPEKIEIDRAKSTLNAPEVDACMISLAGTLPYPASPSKKLTTFTYPFDFKAKR
jgi:hypothetical protein